MKIQLDLRTDLAKVTTATLGPLGSCSYSGPCAVGAMMTPEQREYLVEDGDDFSNIVSLFNDNLVSVPEDQRSDFVKLQKTFDDGDRDPTKFWTTLESLNLKYKTEN